MIKAIKIIAYIIATLFLIGAIWFGLDYKNDKINHLQAEVNILFNYKLNEPALKDRIVNLEVENMRLKQELDNLNIHYRSDELFITYAKGEYLKAMTYITVAEIVTGCTYLGDRELRIEQ